MFEPLNAEDPEAGKGMLLLAYFLQSILLPLSSCGQQKKTARSSIEFICIVLYCISDAILNYKLRRHVIRIFDFIP